MKITVAKSDIEPAISLAATGLSTGAGDITSHFVMRAKDGENSELLTYNGRIGVCVPFVCKVDGSDDRPAFTVEGWRLKQWVTAAGDVSINLSEKDGKVTAKSPRSKCTFRSLDPDNFAFWDETLAEAKLKCKVVATRLRDALNVTKNFVYEKDTQSPDYAVCEVRDSSIQASDRVALSVCVLNVLKDASFRIHGKDIPPVVSFLQAAGDDEVELLEHDHALFIKRSTGEILTVGRPNVQFPKIKYDVGDRDPYQWVLSVDELKAGIQQVSASAEKKDVCLRFKLDEKKGKVLMSMRSVEGTLDTVPLEVAESKEDIDFLTSKMAEAFTSANKKKWASAGTSDDDKQKAIDAEVPKLVETAVGTLSDKGFIVNYMHLKRVLQNHSGDKIRFGITPMQRGGGYVRFKDVRVSVETPEDGQDHKQEGEHDVFLTMLAWVRDLRDKG